MIEVNNLQKTFGKVVAVEDISLSINPGEIVGLLGPNGAGKTTTMRIISGLVKKTAGSVFVNGINVDEEPQRAQQQLGVMPDGGGLYTRLTAIENIRYFGELHKIPKQKLQQKIDELVGILGMESIAHRRAEGFSHGERTKVCLARAIVHSPDYILLDEPTNGLDVLTTRAVRKLLLNQKEQGKAIIFSSHLMHEVNYLCDRALIVSKGRVSAQGTLQELILQSEQSTIEDAFVDLAYGKEAVNV